MVIIIDTLKNKYTDNKTRINSMVLPRISTAFIWIFSIFLLIYFIKAPTMAAESVRNALEVCASRLIPSLFPFIALTGIMSSTGLLSAIAAIIGKPFERLFAINRTAAGVFLLGSIGGFPVGAIMSRDLYERGEITLDEASRLNSFSNNAGIAFCVGGIGASLYGNNAAGWQIYLSQLTAAMIIGIIQSRGKIPSSKSSSKPTSTNMQYSIGELLGRFADSVAKASMTMLKICAFAVFFAVIGDLLTEILGIYFGRYAAALGASFCELTLASQLAAGLGRIASLPMCAFAAGFAGLSVHMQVASVLSEKLPIRRFMLAKLAQGILSAIFTIIACRIITTGVC
ncbi:MAG: hypothetical protein HFE63_08770 [Clostridiales bacterium]|nr:hypothetical protein [Clostridiales bacterium]